MTKPHRPNGQGGIRIFWVTSTETIPVQKLVRLWGLSERTSWAGSHEPRLVDHAGRDRLPHTSDS